MKQRTITHHVCQIKDQQSPRLILKSSAQSLILCYTLLWMAIKNSDSAPKPASRSRLRTALSRFHWWAILHWERQKIPARTILFLNLLFHLLRYQFSLMPTMTWLWTREMNLQEERRTSRAGFARYLCLTLRSCTLLSAAPKIRIRKGYYIGEDLCLGVLARNDITGHLAEDIMHLSNHIHNSFKRVWRSRYSAPDKRALHMLDCQLVCWVALCFIVAPF